MKPLSQLPCDAALLDGEIAVADAQGHTDFGALQDALSGGSGRISYYLFDLLALDGEDLRNRPLVERKEKLKALLADLPKGGPLVYSDHVEGNGAQVFAHACKIKLEGIISKRADAPYRSGRTQTWLKSKCGMEQEFVIIGWRPSDKPRRPFSSLLLAVRETANCVMPGASAPAIRASGWKSSAKKFKALARKTPPVDDVPRTSRGVRISSSRSWSPKSRSAAGRMTVWCGRARSRDCAATSRRPTSSRRSRCRRRKR